MRYLDLTLTPPRPLSPRASRLVVAGLALVTALGALRFALAGAWPVLPFLVLDLGLLALALKVSARAARAAEHVRLDTGTLVVERVSPLGHSSADALDPARAEVELVRAPRGNRLFLRADGRRVSVGAFLSADERAEVARTIDSALRRWRARD